MTNQEKILKLLMTGLLHEYIETNGITKTSVEMINSYIPKTEIEAERLLNNYKKELKINDQL